MQEEAQFYDFSNNINPDQFKVDIGEILAEVNYSDKPIIALICYHIFVFIFALFVRSHRILRTVVFIYCMVFALLTESMGKVLRNNWERFGFSSNYFDDDNVFLLVFFALPPIVTCIFLLSHLVGEIFDRHFYGKTIEKKKKEKEM